MGTLRIPALALCALAYATAARAAGEAAWRALPARLPSDSIAVTLQAWEQRGGPAVPPGDAGYALGQFRYARGEYEAALAAYLRASARLSGDDRWAARRGAALAHLALGRAGAAGAIFEEVARSSAALRSAARLGQAQCLEAQGEPARAYDVLRALLAGEAGESAPAALEALATLATRFGRTAEAAEARRTLARRWPRSIEAARASAVEARAREVGRSPARLETGAAPTRLPAP